MIGRCILILILIFLLNFKTEHELYEISEPFLGTIMEKQLALIKYNFLEIKKCALEYQKKTLLCLMIIQI